MKINATIRNHGDSFLVLKLTASLITRGKGVTCFITSIKYRRQAFLFERLKFANEFMLTIYDKSKLSGMPFKLTLPNFFLLVSRGQGLNFDKLEAKEESILAGESESYLHVKVDGKMSDLHLDRWFLVTENKQSFFVAEVGFSPEAKGSAQIWEQLRDVMRSLRVSDD